MKSCEKLKLKITVNKMYISGKKNKERKKISKVDIYIGAKPSPLDSTESRIDIDN